VGDLSWHPTWTEEPVDAAWEDDIATVVDDAEAALIKRLRTRSLSEREASRFLRERELGDAAIDHVIDRMRSLGYLDDSALAEQLVQHSGVERKGQGRAMLAQTLSARASRARSSTRPSMRCLTMMRTVRSSSRGRKPGRCATSIAIRRCGGCRANCAARVRCERADRSAAGPRRTRATGSACAGGNRALRVSRFPGARGLGSVQARIVE
jgi:hypothetical protein